MSSKTLPTIQSYADAALALSTARFDSKPLGKNARLHKIGDDYVVRYYYTDIVTYRRDGTISLNCGGWQTMSTRDWMEATAPVFIRQVKRKWEIMLDKWVPFVNGMTVIVVKDGDDFVGPKCRLELANPAACA